MQVLEPRPKQLCHLQSSKVPSYRIGRLFHYRGNNHNHRLTRFRWLMFRISGLAAFLGYGAACEFIRRSTAPTECTESPPSLLMVTEANLTHIVSKLTQMPGVALKVGQFLSIRGPCPHILTRIFRCLRPTDTHVLPPDLDRVFRCVQDSVHFMPNWQMEVRTVLAFRHPSTY